MQPAEVGKGAKKEKRMKPFFAPPHFEVRNYFFNPSKALVLGPSEQNILS